MARRLEKSGELLMVRYSPEAPAPEKPESRRKWGVVLAVMRRSPTPLVAGAAWSEEESRGLGVRFPPVAERFERLEETLQICLQMWRGDESPYEGKHYQLERPLNSPQSLSRPHPPIMIGGGGEKKTLRFVARYAQACNLFPTPDLARKLDVLRAHCDAEQRVYDEISKSCYFIFDVGPKGEKANEVIDGLGRLAELGFDTAIGAGANLWERTPLGINRSPVNPGGGGP